MFDITIPRPIQKALRAQDGSPIAVHFAGWIEDVLGVDFWKEGNANELASKLACNERLQDAFEEKSPGDVVRVTDADREWLIKAAQKFSLPPHLSGLSAKCMRFFSAVANAAPVKEETKP